MRWIEDNVYNPKFGFWSRANVGEVLPDPPSPLGWDVVFEGGTVLGWRDCMVNRLGIDDAEVHPTRPEVIGVFGGYAYLGISLLRVWAARTPGFTPDMLDAAYFAGHPDIPLYVAEPWHHNAQTTQVMAGWLGWVMGDRNQYELEADHVASRRLRAERPDLSTLTDLELYERTTAQAVHPLVVRPAHQPVGCRIDRPRHTRRSLRRHRQPDGGDAPACRHRWRRLGRAGLGNVGPVSHGAQQRRAHASLRNGFRWSHRTAAC